MITRQATIDVLNAIRKDIRVNGLKNYHLNLAVCKFVNSLFCNCAYCEYFVFDMSFGQNECHTEMGHEMKGIDTVEKFVEFLFRKQ